MRPVLLSDLTAVARALLRVPPSDRRVLCEQIVFQAEMADRYVGKLSREHPLWGNGTLLSAVGRRTLEAERVCDDPEYCACLTLVLHTLGEGPISRDM